MAFRADLVVTLHREVLDKIVSRHPTFKLDDTVDKHGFIVYFSEDDRFQFLRNRLRNNSLFKKLVRNEWLTFKMVEKLDLFVLEVVDDIFLKYDIKEISFNYELDSTNDMCRIDYIYNPNDNKWELLKNYCILK